MIDDNGQAACLCNLGGQVSSLQAEIAQICAISGGGLKTSSRDCTEVSNLDGQVSSLHPAIAQGAASRGLERQASLHKASESSREGESQACTPRLHRCTRV